MKTCKLIFPNEPTCSGKVFSRTVGTALVDCCEKHYVVFKQVQYLAECGTSAELLKTSTMASRALLIRKIEEAV